MLLTDYMVYGDRSRLMIHETAIVNNASFNLLSGTIKLEEYVSCAHGTSFITGTHDFEKFDLERQLTAPTSGRDITVKRGAWISANATVLGPCVIGEHSVVAAGSVVTKDVPPLTIVAGVPARILRRIESPRNGGVTPEGGAFSP